VDVAADAGAQKHVESVPLIVELDGQVIQSREFLVAAPPLQFAQNGKRLVVPVILVARRHKVILSRRRLLDVLLHVALEMVPDSVPCRPMRIASQFCVGSRALDVAGWLRLHRAHNLVVRRGGRGGAVMESALRSLLRPRKRKAPTLRLAAIPAVHDRGHRGAAHRLFGEHRAPAPPCGFIAAPGQSTASLRGVRQRSAAVTPFDGDARSALRIGGGIAPFLAFVQRHGADEAAPFEYGIIPTVAVVLHCVHDALSFAVPLGIGHHSAACDGVSERSLDPRGGHRALHRQRGLFRGLRGRAQRGIEGRRRSGARRRRGARIIGRALRRIGARARRRCLGGVRSGTDRRFLGGRWRRARGRHSGRALGRSPRGIVGRARRRIIGGHSRRFLGGTQRGVFRRTQRRIGRRRASGRIRSAHDLDDREAFLLSAGDFKVNVLVMLPVAHRADRERAVFVGEGRPGGIGRGDGHNVEVRGRGVERQIAVEGQFGLNLHRHPVVLGLDNLAAAEFSRVGRRGRRR